MTPWIIFFTGSLLLTLLIAVGTLLYQRKHVSDNREQTAAQDVLLLIVLAWLASLSVLAYIAFAFGKR